MAEAETFVAGIGVSTVKKAKDGLLARLRFFKGFLYLFIKMLAKEAKVEDIQKLITQCEKHIGIIQETIGEGDTNISKCFDSTVTLTFPFVLHPKKIPEYNRKAGYEKMSLYLTHCNSILKILAAKEMFDVWRILEDYMHSSPSILSRAVCNLCLFPAESQFTLGKTPLSTYCIVISLLKKCNRMQ